VQEDAPPRANGGRVNGRSRFGPARSCLVWIQHNSTNDTQAAPAPGAAIRKSGEPLTIPNACRAEVIYR
jgi:hypothetical protein